MLAWVSALALAAAPLLPISAAEKQADKWITADVLKAHTRFLASDLLEGRGPATTGDKLAQEYIASQFEQLGLKPGAPEGGWYQPFDLVGVNGNPDALTFVGPNQKKLSFKYLDDFICVAGE